MATRTLDLRAFNKVKKKVLKYLEKELPRNALKEFIKNTPKDRGNARSKTKLRKNFKGFSIIANYKYADVLDKGLFPNPPKEGTGKTKGGYSKQSPKGMIEPTVEYIKKETRTKIRRT
jgi:hypothetical protein